MNSLQRSCTKLETVFGGVSLACDRGDSCLQLTGGELLQVKSSVSYTPFRLTVRAIDHLVGFQLYADDGMLDTCLYRNIFSGINFLDKILIY